MTKLKLSLTCVCLWILLAACAPQGTPPAVPPTNTLPASTFTPSPTATYTQTPAPPTATPGLGSVRINPVDAAPMVFVPAGDFEMGAAAQTGLDICQQYRDDCLLEDFADEGPAHTVSLDAYWIYQLEVSNALYKVCVEAGACSSPALTEFYNLEAYADHSVVYVTWYDAESYCQWAGGRLPSEAEWEKAARGTDGRTYPWGEQEADCTLANFRGCTFEGITAPVGSTPAGASPYGALDMAGNVLEWVEDWYDPAYYTVSPVDNPPGPETGEYKIARGGSWKNLPVGLRVVNRGANFPEVYSTGAGFRCVLPGE